MNVGKAYTLSVNAAHALKLANSLAGSTGRPVISSDIFIGLLYSGDYVALSLEKAGINRSEYEGVAAKNIVRKDSVTQVEILEAAHIKAQSDPEKRTDEIDTCHLLEIIIFSENCNAHRILDIMKISRGVLMEIYVEVLNIRQQKAIHSEYRSSPSSVRKTAKPLGSALAAFCTDLTLKALEGVTDPIVGRDKEIERTIDILMRRTKSNPCLIGEAGVGKTAIVEGVAQRIAAGDVPDKLKDTIIAELSLPSLVAGTKHRGDFEERITRLIEEVTARGDVILFIDEIHTLVRSGAAEGAIDCANILKPYLARGELRVVGATTIQEYRKHIEPDAALGRRFHEIIVSEVDEATAISIVNTLKPRYESYHNVSIEDDVVKTAVKLAVRYLPDKRLPDKAIDLIDETAARACARNKHYITSNDVAVILSEMTGINISRLTQEESEDLLKLEDTLHERVIGQDKAVSTLARAIRRGKTGLHNPNRPIGSFLFTGPTGVGKTELCVALADCLFKRTDSLIRLDMSEYMENHSVSKILGAAPGYIGYGDSGSLTDRVRTKPYAVLLFDEIEKAHPDIWNVLLQIMEDGSLTDSHGRTVSFKNTIIVMTSNIGAQCITEPKAPIGFGHTGVKPNCVNDVSNELKATFRPEFLNRIDNIVVFEKLTLHEMKAIAVKYMDELAARLMENGVTLKITDAAIDWLTCEGFDERYGARPLRRVIQRSIEDKIADLLLSGELSESEKIECDIADGEIVFEVNPLAYVA